MRYGLQPVNGDHLGVSTYRDYSLVLPAAKDRSLALPPVNNWKSGATNPPGPAIRPFSCCSRRLRDASKSDPAVIHDAEKNTWSVVLPLSLRIKGQNENVPYPVRLVVIGAAAA